MMLTTVPRIVVVAIRGSVPGWISEGWHFFFMVTMIGGSDETCCTYSTGCLPMIQYKRKEHYSATLDVGAQDVFPPDLRSHIIFALIDHYTSTESDH